MHTHLYGGAVAGPAVAQIVVVGDDVDHVLVATVEVGPRAVVLGGGAHVGVAIRSHGDGRVGLGPVAASPADRARVVLTFYVALQVMRRAGSCGGHTHTRTHARTHAHTHA